MDGVWFGRMTLEMKWACRKGLEREKLALSCRVRK